MKSCPARSGAIADAVDGRALIPTLRTTLSLLLALTLPAFGATYYVDFAGGDNRSDGLTPQTAWQHSPGDRNATDNPRTVTLAPGDTVIFKGGVRYFGELQLSVSGRKGLPITLDGNTAGTFGEGRAMLDGARVITDWKPVTTPDAVHGNPRWHAMLYADLDVDLANNFNHGRFVLHRDAGEARQVPWQRVFLIDGETQLLPIAQVPKPSDPFYPDLPADFFHSPHRLSEASTHRMTDVTPDRSDGSGPRRSSVIRDEANLVQEDAHWFDGAFASVHGGNNHVYFARVERFDPRTHELHLPQFQPSTYAQTRYALYNSPRFINQPGEWCLVPIAGGRTRVYLLPEPNQDERPTAIGYPVLRTGILLSGAAAHIDIRGFRIQRYAGGSGAVATRRAGQARPRHIRIADCDIRFISGHAGISLNHSDHVTVEHCTVYQCPGWTVGIYVNRVNHFRLSDNRLEKNSGSGIRHYEAGHGVVENNAVLDHFGMHASGINVYEGCADILFTGNTVHNTVAINRNAERLVFRNNVIDGRQRAPLAVGIWTSGQVGGRAIRDLHFINNTFVNTNTDIAWATGILGQRRGSPGAPQGLVIRGNVLDGLAEDIAGVIEGNLYTRPVAARFMGPGCRVVSDPAVLFRDPARGDFRRKPGGPVMDAGANIPPPAAWSP